MIKLKKLIKESLWGDRKFGEPLPTVKDYKEAYDKKSGIVEEEMLNEGPDWKKVQTILSRIKKDLDTLVKYGEDFGVFESAKYAHKTLKKAWRDISRIK